MNKVKELRVKKGLSIRELAKQSGIGSATLTRLERGEKAYATTLYKLAEFFGVEYSELESFEAISPKRNHLTTLNLQVV